MMDVHKKIQEATLRTDLISIPDLIALFDDDLDLIYDHLTRLCHLGFIDPGLFSIGWIKLTIHGQLTRN